MKESFFTIYLNIATVILISFLFYIIYRMCNINIILENDLYDIGIILILLFLINILRKNKE